MGRPTLDSSGQAHELLGGAFSLVGPQVLLRNPPRPATWPSPAAGAAYAMLERAALLDLRRHTRHGDHLR
jgi:hypothetical protein